MNQPGLKPDGLADVLQRARQVTTARGTAARGAPRDPAGSERAGALFSHFFFLCCCCSELLRSVNTRAHARARTPVSLLTSCGSAPERDWRPGWPTLRARRRSGTKFDGTLRSCHPGRERAGPGREGGGPKFGHTCPCARRQPVGLWERTTGRTRATVGLGVPGSGTGRAEVEGAGWRGRTGPPHPHCLL